MLPISTEGAEAAEKVFGVEAIFGPNNKASRRATHTVLTAKMSTVAVVSRKAFDKIVLQSKEVASFVQFIRSNVADATLSIDSLAHGLPCGIIDEFWQEYGEDQDAGDVASEDLGVCAAYLVKQFPEDITNIPGTDFNVHGVTTFSELGHFFWGEKGKFQGFNGCAEHICPRDGMAGSSLVDSLEGDKSGNATHFVSWCWNYTIETVVSALTLFVEDNHLDATQVFFWMCFFCNNQRKMLIQKEDCSLTSTFGDRLQKIGRMIILLDTYQGPYYTKRVWCIYETYVSTTSGVKTDVAIPKSVKHMFNKTLEHGGFSEIAASLSDIDAESAQASKQADAHEIKGLIRNSIGFPAVNETVKCALINWLALAFGDCLKQNSISEVSRHIYEMIAGKSGSPTLTMSHWGQTARKHPELLEYLGFGDMQPDESFCLLSTNDALTFTMQDLDNYLHKQDKTNINTFAAWLRENRHIPNMETLRIGLQTELNGKMEDLQGQLARVEDARKSVSTTNAI